MALKTVETKLLLKYNYDTFGGINRLAVASCSLTEKNSSKRTTVNEHRTTILWRK